MRKLAVLFVILSIVLISGCTAQDPAQIVRDSVTKLDALNSYEIDYNYSISMYNVMSMGGDMKIYKKQDRMRTDMDMSLMGAQITVSIYYLPSGTFSCATVMGNVTCVRGESSSTQTLIFDPEKSLDAMETMMERGIVTLRYLGTGSVVNRNCHNISSDINASKLNQLTPEEKAALGMNTTTISDPDILKTFRITQCYDSGTGMSLAAKVFMEMNLSQVQTGLFVMQNMTMEMVMTASSFEPNKAIPDSVFELPAEPEEGM